jgi:hypothetical protein
MKDPDQHVNGKPDSDFRPRVTDDSASPEVLEDVNDIANPGLDNLKVGRLGRLLLNLLSCTGQGIGTLTVRTSDP